MNKLNEHIGSVIKFKRAKEGLSQDELAAKLNITKSTISRYENGIIDIPLSKLQTISEICSFPVRDYIAPVESEISIDAIFRFNKSDPEQKKLSDDYKEYLFKPGNESELERVCKGYEIMMDYSISGSDTSQLKDLIVENAINSIKSKDIANRLMEYINKIHL